MLNKLAIVSGLVLFSTAINAQDIDIKITNLTQGLHFTPILIAAHTADNQLFSAGTTASSELQIMAEGGDISGLVTTAASISADVVENPASGLLAPSMMTMTNLMTDDTNNRLTITAMILPTNDGFVGVNSWPIPTEAGTYTFTMNAYDAGTEANDEIINGGGMSGVAGIPAAPGGNAGTGGSGITMTESNNTVHIHRGNIGDTDLSGGVSDVDSRIHRWLNPVAKVTVTVK